MSNLNNFTWLLTFTLNGQCQVLGKRFRNLNSRFGSERASQRFPKPTITNARCALSLTKRLPNSFFAVNDMNPGRPSTIVASAACVIVRTWGKRPFVRSVLAAATKLVLAGRQVS